MRNEPHPESRWTHPICSSCYALEEPGRIPTKVNTLGQAIGVIELCCFCGKGTVEGIWYRKDPGEVHPI